MAPSKFLTALLLLSLLLLHVAEAASQTTGFNGESSPASLPPPIDCKAACGGRCRLSKRPRLCNRSCGSCCARCNCVPPGTYGNLDACPCYARLTTHNNVRKCP